jgi:hypothetical protein
MASKHFVEDVVHTWTGAARKRSEGQTHANPCAESSDSVDQLLHVKERMKQAEMW